MDNPERLSSSIRRLAVRGAALLFFLIPIAASAQISLSTAVTLAEKSSPRIRSATANMQRATAAVQEAKDAYIPSVLFGASPGYAYGFPLGYPSLFKADSGSLLLSFSQPDYIRSARAALKAADESLKDEQQQVALDVAQDYVELDHDVAEIATLDEEKSYADTLVSLEDDRVRAGVDPRVSELQAQLTAAQVNEKRIHLQNDADEMRQKISHLTGLPADGLNTVSTSIPAVPPLGTEPDSQIAQNSPGIQAAYENARSKYYQAWGDERQNYRPLITFGAEYSLFEKFADYTQYFPRNFQYNNAAIGAVIQIPFFDATRRAKARQSIADAIYTEAQADQSRDTLSEQTLLARRTALELSAQQRVAQIQSELAKEQMKTVESELTNGTGSASTQPVSPITAQKVHIEERERYEDLLDTNFSLLKVQLSLLRMTGQISDWVNSSVK